ncbi:MAG: thermonuclease family protein [Candidatus Omnitrophica bacterium]|nr:thermonuclease family protein [Candidatus Omnitrophota bacterium]
MKIRHFRKKTLFTVYLCLTFVICFFSFSSHSCPGNLEVSLGARRIKDIVGAFSLSPSINAVHKLIVLDKQKIVVVDGDTLHYDDERVRLLGVDCPELATDTFGGRGQEPYATEAKDFVIKRLQEGTRIELVLIEEQDKYGRSLGHIFIDGESLSLELIRRGLGYETVSRYGDNGFTELSAQILEAAKKITPSFENPSEWRKKNRR